MSGYRQWSADGWRAHLPGAADPGGLAAELGERTLPELAAATAASVPGTAVAFTAGGDTLTHAGLDRDAARTAGWLRRRTGPGDRVLLAADSGTAFIRWYLGALRAGLAVVLASPAYTGPELDHLAADSGAALAIAGPDVPLPPRLPRADVRDVPSGRPASPVARPDDVAVLAYTSGTTGTPKAVPLTHRRLATSIRAAMAAWRWSGDDVLAHALPLHHQHGLGGVHTALISGGGTHLLPKFAPDAFAALIAERRPTVIFGVPTIYQALLERGAPVPAPRLAVCGSAPLSPLVASRLPAVLGQIPLIRYGTTETGLSVSNTLDARHPGTVGVPLPGVEVRIRDLASGADAPRGQEGEIQVSGPQVFGGYRDRADGFTEDGWFRTGDIGMVRDDGQLVLRGRIKEMIITGGLNVYPREVELALEAHPDVVEAAVAGLPDERWGEQVTAWVVLRDGAVLDEAALLGHARGRLAAYKCPKRVFQIGALPRNHLGKLLRAALTSGR